MALTSEQKKYLAENFSNKANKVLADEIGANVGQVCDFAKYQGLKKSPAHRKVMAHRAAHSQQTKPEEEKRARIKAYQAQYAKSNRDSMRKNGKIFREKHRRSVLTHYSNGTLQCACCHLSFYPFLVIDHLHGGGLQHLRELGIGGGTRFCRYLIKKGYPEGYQVLCDNCNKRKSNKDRCDCPFDFTQPNNLKSDHERSVLSCGKELPSDLLLPVCAQYTKKLEAGEMVEDIPLDDFDFQPVPLERKGEAIQFVKKYEWLGTLPVRPSHWFCSVHRSSGRLAGVLVFSVPYKPSHALGAKEVELERLLARGATAAWTPKNLGSKLIMQALAWMVKNTKYRLFCGYSDPLAGEVGTIYQACNFFYLGGKGATTMYAHPSKPEKWFNRRYFRNRAAWLRYAKELNLNPCTDIVWNGEWTPDWEKTNSSVTAKLIEAADRFKGECLTKDVPRKGKYFYVLGATPSETKQLRKAFLKRNTPEPYPKRFNLKQN